MSGIIKRPNLSGENQRTIVFLVIITVLLAIVIVLMIRANNTEKNEENKDVAVSNAYNIGDFIKLGKYEQDNDIANGREDIEWIIVDVQEDKVLAVSKYGIDTQLFHRTREAVTWETSDLRKWLNNDFYNSAFSNDQQNKIISTLVTADKHPINDESTGNDTADKIFLLSISEANRYFDSDEKRKCQATVYA